MEQSQRRLWFGFAMLRVPRPSGLLSTFAVQFVLTIQTGARRTEHFVSRGGRERAEDGHGRMTKSSGQLSTTIPTSDTKEQARVAETLATSDLDFRQVVDGIPALITVMNAGGEVEFVNRQVLKYSGKTFEELKSSVIGDAVHPDDLPGVVAAWKRSVETGNAFESEHRHRRADGVYRWFRVRGLPKRDATGSVFCWYIVQNDAEDRKRAEFLLAVEKRSLEMIGAGASLEEILNNLCNSIDALTSGAISTILRMEPERQELWYVAGPRVRPSWLPVIMPRPIGPCEGCCGTAAYRKERVIVSDVLTDPVWPADYRGFTVENGIRAAWSEPILTKDREVLGTFACTPPSRDRRRPPSSS